jgi:hypothetical protein
LPSFHPVCLPFPTTGIHFQRGPLLPSCSSFFKCILIVQSGFPWRFHACIYGTSNRLTPSIIYSFSWQSGKFRTAEWRK